ncbi:MAG: shikimate dehydrogenase [Bacteroidales bacterium]|jgi:shikimate dehydrogenase|nr:shikimate dehydrogenase [Bacteroidales bacterium]
MSVRQPKYGLIGYPLMHSCSPDFYRQQYAIDFQLFPLQKITELPTLLTHMPDLKGFGVTMPYKEAIMPYLHLLSEEAQQIKAVNCVKVERRGDKLMLCGFNTDAVGFKKTLENVQLPAKALIFGTGGASKAVAYVLASLSVAYQFVSRTKTDNNLIYSEVTPEIWKQYPLLINTTPIGMYPDTEAVLTLPYEALTPEHWLIDLIYNPLETLFLKEGRIRGCKTQNGLAMLHRQAECNWQIWTS